MNIVHSIYNYFIITFHHNKPGVQHTCKPCTNKFLYSHIHVRVHVCLMTFSGVNHSDGSLQVHVCGNTEKICYGHKGTVRMLLMFTSITTCRSRHAFIGDTRQKV